ncbi:zinc-ribbon domain-containing protein [Parvularcula dongshanensis]|uniref:Putative Zn finger-like uncharacterized protein n=1 Tax=Parvularcula dongshanensis TaxID=1173995 RepID=A0A840I2R8_9PROT|nr:zinc-ribbon domain-containing protein [Parvularcula dongshanensis]MBB4658592.1 putative Zn finger-like uncharacterized protein [Parvularcula dongshanensis]
MLISCPGCLKAYRVPASAIPPGGREVRCSSCEKVWFERGQIAQVIAAGAAAADVAPAAPVVRFGDEALPSQTVIDALYDGPARQGARAAEADDAPQDSPARGQQQALAIVYAAPPTVARPAAAPNDPVPPAGEAMRILLRSLAQQVAPAVGGLARSVRILLAALRPAARTERPVPKDEATRRARGAMRTKAANAMTPARFFGWTLLAATVASLTYVVVAAPDRVQSVFPPAGNLYAYLRPPAAAPALSVEAALGRYALSDQGPAVSITGVVRNDGLDETFPRLVLTATGPAGSEAQVVPLPAVPLPPGGERPFAVRALLPEGVWALNVAVEPGEASEREGFALQSRGSGWGAGHAGPPVLGGAPR